MKEASKIIGVLTFVCLVCAFFLSLVDGFARPKIEANAEKRTKEAIFNLKPQTVAIEPSSDENIFKLKDKNGNLIGYSFLAEGQGYQGTIKMLVAVDVSWQSLEGIEIIDSIETPGLGAKIQDESFRSQFKHLDISLPIEYLKKDPQKDNQIKAITGATVSSKAVVNILNKKIKEVRKQLK